MKLLTTDKIKDKIINELKEGKIKNSIHLFSKNPTEEANFYKKMIIKRCVEFGISYKECEFGDKNISEILTYINTLDENDGYIILAPFGKDDDLTLLKNEIKLRDLDGFTYKSLGLGMEGDRSSLPATAKALARFIDDSFSDLRGINITIANRTTIIGKPLAAYLISRGATVTIINSATNNSKNYIKGSDIFITAIGRANYYDKSFFKDNMTIIDVGTSFVDGMLMGDVDYESLEDMNVNVLTNKKGIGAITTLCLLNSMQ